MDRLIEEVIFSCGRFIQHPDDIHEGRFTGAARPHQCEKLPLLYVEVDAFENECSLKTGVDILIDVA
jgi:hypothetical protein